MPQNNNNTIDKKHYINRKMKIKETSTHIQYSDFGGSEILVEGFWEDITGKSWMFSGSNPAVLTYTIRSIENNLPLDNEVLYGHINGFGSLVHITELEEL